MAISEWYSDEELISQIQMFFDMEETENIDFEAFLSQITEVDENTREIKVKGRTFHFDIEFCDVEEIT